MKQRRMIWYVYPWFLIITLIAILALTWYTSAAFRHYALKKTESDLLNQCHLLQSQFMGQTVWESPETTDRLCKALGKEASTRITLIQPDGRVLCDSEKPTATMDNHRDRPEFIQAIHDGKGSSIRVSNTLNAKFMYVAIPLEGPSGIMGVLRTSLSISAMDKELTSIQTRILLIGLIIALFSAGVSFLVSRRITRPILQMKHGAERFAGGDLAHRLPTPPSFELAGLAHAMNQMAVQLKKRIETIIDQQKEYEAVLSSMVEGVIAIDNDDRLLSMNKAARTVLKTGIRSVEKRAVQEVLRNPNFLKFISESHSDDALEDRDFELGENHHRRIINVRNAPLLNAMNRRMGTLIVLNDVTRVRHLENVRKDFVANVSHEIKTPLTAIKGFVETLYQTLENRSEDTDRFIAIILRHVDRLNTIIEDLLSLSRLEQIHKKEELHLQSRNLKGLMESAIHLIQHRSEAKQISIDLVCDPEISIAVDATIFEQALINLLDNAITYSPEKGQIRISGDSDGHELRIHVVDHGPGIAQSHLPRLFERFYRVDKARSRAMGGTGLGLAIVKHIIQAHGGRVSVESELGNGSTFTIHLPYAVDAP